MLGINMTRTTFIASGMILMPILALGVVNMGDKAPGFTLSTWSGDSVSHGDLSTEPASATRFNETVKSV